MKNYNVVVLEKKSQKLICELEVEAESKSKIVKLVNNWLLDGTIDNPSNLYGWGVHIYASEIKSLTHGSPSF